LSVISWNPNGLPPNRLWDGTASFLSSVDIFGVWDTRNNVNVVDIVESHVVHHTAVTPGDPKVSGLGGAIGISNAIASFVQFAGWHPHIPLGWVKLPSYFIGFVYARHSMISGAQGKVQFMAHLHAAVAEKQCMHPVILMGDFNAGLGCEVDASQLPRTMLGHACSLGKMVMGMARRCHLATTTGRLDTHEMTWVKKNRAGHILQSSRIDHAFVDCALWSNVLQFEVIPQMWGSDHHPLRLLLHACVLGQGCTRQAVLSPPFLLWDFNKQALYTFCHVKQTWLWSVTASHIQSECGLGISSC